MSGTQKIFISAGEASGDLLGANLACALLQKNPSLQLYGMGGEHMRNAGVAIKFNAEKLSVIGVIEIIKHLPSIFSTWRAIKKCLRDTKPDLIILIDFPDTHFRFLKTAKKLGIPVLYYVSPQIWAWRASRIHTIKKYIDHMAVLFAFEEKIYRDANVPVTFVGHPLSDIVKPTLSIEAAYNFFQLDREKKIVALFPGSRRSELDNHLSIVIEVANKISNTQFVLVLAPHFDIDKIRAQIPAHIRIIQYHLYDLLQITDAAIAVSGTITLEIGLMQVPLCVIYRMKPLTYWIGKTLIRVKYIGLCNIVCEKMVAKEFIQNDVTATNIADETIRLLNDETYYTQIKNELRKIKKAISIPEKNAGDSVADIALKLLHKPSAGNSRKL